MQGFHGSSCILPEAVILADSEYKDIPQTEDTVTITNRDRLTSSSKNIIWTHLTRLLFSLSSLFKIKVDSIGTQLSAIDAQFVDKIVNLAVD